MNIPPRKDEGKLLVTWVSDIPKMGLVLGPFILGMAPHLTHHPGAFTLHSKSLLLREVYKISSRNFIKSRDCWDEL